MTYTVEISYILTYSCNTISCEYMYVRHKRTRNISIQKWINGTQNKKQIDNQLLKDDQPDLGLHVPYDK